MAAIFHEAVDGGRSRSGAGFVRRDVAEKEKKIDDSIRRYIFSGRKFDEIFRGSELFETVARDDRVSRSSGPITELNNNTETFASTCLKVHRFSVYKFPPRGVETVNRIYIRGGGGREGIRWRKDPAYTREDKRKK